MSLLGRHLTGIADFSGRENRQPFWLWILIAYATQMVVSMVVMIPLMMSWISPMMEGDPQRFDDHPELMMQTMAPMMSNMMMLIVVLSVVWLILVAAAVVRRLHDGDHPGWWAAPVFALQIAMPLVYMQIMPKFFAAFATIQPGMTPDEINAKMLPMMQSFGWVSLLGTLSFLLTILLIVALCLAGTDGPNRYGEDPLAFR